MLEQVIEGVSLAICNWVTQDLFEKQILDFVRILTFCQETSGDVCICWSTVKICSIIHVSLLIKIVQNNGLLIWSKLINKIVT
jgi:hypothetical protein